MGLWEELRETWGLLLRRVYRRRHGLTEAQYWARVGEASAADLRRGVLHALDPRFAELTEEEAETLREGLVEMSRGGGEV